MAGWNSGVLRYGSKKSSKVGERKPKKKSLVKYKKETWAEFSRYIRMKYADENGMVVCVTCGAVKHYRDQQAGHFLDGRRNSVLFDERNVHPQCVKCNMFNGGAKVAYYDYMRGRYGQEVIDELKLLDKQERKFTVIELQEMAKRYKMAQ